MSRGTVVPEKLDSKETAEPKGLCSTCKKASFCTFPRLSGRPVVQCEEFEGIESPPNGEVGNLKTLPSARRVNPPPSGEGSETYRGLCKFCAKRDSCTFPKPEGGVWHCEEYS